MMVEIAVIAFLFLAVFCSLLRHTKPADHLRRQKAYSLQEADVWLTCASKVRALNVPNRTSTSH
jgi:hypothetical protein